ncbi:MAG: type II secretion system secretin GspD [Betaproteobacteria bacterium]|nr:type II secretion system secretin GspD [Betaproteobacteria bacterium]
MKTRELPVIVGNLRAQLSRWGFAAALCWALVPLVSPDAAQAQPAAPKAEKGVTLNLQATDIDAAARAMASVLGKPVIVDPRVKGQVTIVTEGPVSKDNALAQFGAALRAQGFAMVEASGLIKVVPEADAKLQGGAVTVGGATVAPRGEQIVTQVIKLNYENAANLVPVLRPLIAPNNTINANLGNNSLIITDYAENLRRIARIVAALDVPNSTDLEIIPLKYSVASDMVNTVNRLLEGTGTPGAVPGQAGAGNVVLADARTNSLMVRAANPARMALIKSLVAKLDQASQGEGNLHVVYLKNAQADKLAEILRNLLTGQSGTVGARNSAPLGGGSLGQSMAGGGAPGAAGAPPSGVPSAASGGGGSVGGGGGGGMGNGVAVQADLASNALIITAPEPLYKQLRGVIDQLDTRRAQVYIEALVAEVDNSKLDEFGVQWQALARNASNTSGVYVGTNLPNSGASLLNLQAAAAGGNAAAAAGAVGDLRGLNFAVVKKIGGIVTIPALARALESSGDGNVLSTPNILALDNEEAKFTSGQNVPFITGQFTNTGAGGGGSVNPFQTIERKDVGIQLRVRPQISEGGTIKLQIYLEVSSVASAGTSAGIITNKSSIDNTIIVDDGQMIALGGLLKDGYSSSRDKVPLLGDVPVLGALFRYEKRQRDKVNLMIFLRPVIIRDSDTAATLLQDRYEMMRSATQATQPEWRLWSQDMAAPVLPPLPAPAPKAAASQPAAKRPVLGDAPTAN